MQDFQSFSREEFEHAHTRVNRFRESVKAMVRISETPIGSDRGLLVAGETVAALKAVAASVESLNPIAGEKTSFIATTAGIAEVQVKRVVAVLKDRVLTTGAPVHFQEVDSRQNGPIQSYLGVPIMNAEGSIVAIASVFGGKNRHFGEEDEWWLKLVGQLFAESVQYHNLECRLKNLEELLHPKQSEPVSVPETEVKKTVLVIDDDRHVNDLLCEYLDMQGYAVDAAFNGVEALRVRAPSLPIILISGYSTAEWNQDYLHKQGVSAVLRKPLDLDELASAVHKLLPA
jgi:CheY-like chemotaxis protein